MVIYKKLKKTWLVLPVVCLLGCEGFLTGDLLDSNPNKIDDVDQISVESLFVGSQVTMYGFMEGYINRLVTMFMQQLSGQLYSHADDYNCAPLDWRLDSRWSDLYGTGGLVDLRTIQSRAKEQEKFVLLGIAQMWEALVFSTAADLWGDLPYSQATDSRYPEPVFDSQKKIHDDILLLIDRSISNLEKGQDFSMLNDFTFDGDTEKWIRCANTLKARIRLNWAEVDGEAAYQEALLLAQGGILEQSGDGDWKPLHREGSNNEESVWFQFFQENQFVMGAGHLLVELLKKDGDGRLGVYFDPSSAFNDTVVGVVPGGSVPPYASQLNLNTVGSEGWAVEWVSWHENQFIIAECQYNLGNTAGALETLNNVMSALEERWRVFDTTCVLPRYSNTSGQEVISAIMNEKYKALFLNMQVFSDWRRTGYPKFEDRNGATTACEVGVPRRLLYPELEKNTNPNAPAGDSIFERVENDPF